MKCSHRKKIFNFLIKEKKRCYSESGSALNSPTASGLQDSHMKKQS